MKGGPKTGWRQGYFTNNSNILYIFCGSADFWNYYLVPLVKFLQTLVGQIKELKVKFCFFQPQKYDFDIYKGFLQRKWPAFTRFPKKQRKGNCQISTTIFQQVTKILKASQVFLLSYWVYSRIWLNQLWPVQLHPKFINHCFFGKNPSL